jgi:hypothetical protein
MRRRLLLLIGLAVILAACGTPATPLPTPRPEPSELPGALQLYVAMGQAEATKQAIEATQIWIYGQQTATAEIRDIRATQQAAAATQQAFGAQTTATHEAFAAHQVATERSFNATGTAQAQGTATAYPITATAQSVARTATMEAWKATATMDAAYGAAQATQASANAQEVELSVERTRVTNMTRAWVPWMGFVVALGLIGVAILRITRNRIVQKDAFGASPVIIRDGVVIDVDRLPGPALRVLKDGNVELVDGDKDVTTQTQKVQMVRALPASRADPEQVLNLAMTRVTPTVEVVQPMQVGRVILDEISDQVIEEE